MSLSKEKYQEYVDLLASSDLKIKLDRSPTTMGPGYIADKIGEILEAKSTVNDMAEKVELALCEAEVKLNVLEEEINLRTHIEYNDRDSEVHDIRNAAAREAYIWKEIEQKYIDDRNAERRSDEPQAEMFQLRKDLSVARTDIIELKALQKILHYRRDELIKLDSGVRLQQKTMETEASIYGKEGKPLASPNGDYSIPEDRKSQVEPSALDDPGAMDDEEDFDVDPPPIKG